MNFNMGIVEIVPVSRLPFSIFDPLPSIQIRIGTSNLVPSIFHWKLLGYPELVDKIPGKCFLSSQNVVLEKFFTLETH